MSLHTIPDVSIVISSQNSSSERRITPSWSIATLKAKLEPVTGIPPASQRLVVNGAGSSQTSDAAAGEGKEISATNEASTTLEGWRLSRGDVIFIHDLRPPGARPNFSDPSSVEKYSLPPETYESLPDTVLAWKRAQGLGRFDPAAPARQEKMVRAHEEEAREKGLAVTQRCRIGGEDARRGMIAHLGEVPEIPGPGGWWVGVLLDEPVGRNDGTVPGGKRYFGAAPKHGVFVRPERVEVGEFPVLNDLEELEEI